MNTVIRKQIEQSYCLNKWAILHPQNWGLAILQLDTKELVYLDQVGTGFLDKLLKEKTFQNTLVKLESEYEAPAQKLKQDLEQLINDLMAARIIEFAQD